MKKIIEQLPPDDIIQVLQAHKSRLEKLLELKDKALSKAPEGSLRVNRAHGCYQYYHVTTPRTHGRYLPKRERELAKALAQKDYNQRVIPEIKREIAIFSRVLAALAGGGAPEKPTALPGGVARETFDLLSAGNALAELPLSRIARVYAGLSEARQKLVEPVTLSDEEYARRWLSEKYTAKGFDPGAPEYLSKAGLRVRSKSEEMIADALDARHIPFKYECQRKLKDYKVHPDFTCLNVHTRQEFVWEHFGMMDNPEYAASNVKKFNDYQTCGYVLGQNFIISMETKDNPLNGPQIEKLLDDFLAGTVPA